MSDTPKRAGGAKRDRTASEPLDPTAAMEAWTRGVESYLKTVEPMNREVGEFVSKRLHHNADLMRRLMGCKDLHDVVEAQQGWWQEALEEYQAEWSRLLEMRPDLGEAAAGARAGGEADPEPAGDTGAGRAGGGRPRNRPGTGGKKSSS